MPLALIHFILVRFNACLPAIVNERHCLSPTPVPALYPLGRGAHLSRACWWSREGEAGEDNKSVYAVFSFSIPSQFAYIWFDSLRLFWMCCLLCELQIEVTRREFFRPKIAIFPQFWVYSNYNPKDETNCNNFYSAISYRRVRQESDELLYVRFGHSLWSASQLPAEGIKTEARRVTDCNQRQWRVIVDNFNRHSLESNWLEINSEFRIVLLKPTVLQCSNEHEWTERNEVRRLKGKPRFDRNKKTSKSRDLGKYNSLTDAARTSPPTLANLV